MPPSCVSCACFEEFPQPDPPKVEAIIDNDLRCLHLLALQIQHTVEPTKKNVGIGRRPEPTELGPPVEAEEEIQK